MSSSKLIRLCGLAAILGVVLSVIAVVMGSMDSGSVSESATTIHYVVEMGLWLFAGMLMLAALIGLYVRHSEAAGILGLIGFIVAFIGTSLMLGSWWANAFVPPALAVEAPRVLSTPPAGALAFGYMASSLIAALSWLLFGISAFKARIYPRIPTILLMIGGALLVAPLPGVGLVFSVAIAWLGLTLLTEERASSGRTVPVS